MVNHLFCPKHGVPIGLKGSWCPEVPLASDLVSDLKSLRSPSLCGTGRVRNALAGNWAPALEAMNGWLPCQAGSLQSVQKVRPVMKGELLGAELPGAVWEAALINLPWPLSILLPPEPWAPLPGRGGTQVPGSAPEFRWHRPH